MINLNIFAEKRLMTFTERLSELLSSGLSLQKSLTIIARISSDKKLRGVCLKLQQALSSGSEFSVAMTKFPDLKIPGWYAAYLNVAQECGNLTQILLYIQSLLNHEKEAREKFLSAIAYPVFVVFLTALSGFLSVKYFLPAFSDLFPADAEEIRSRAMETMLMADIFLALSFLLISYLVASFAGVSPCMGVLRTMNFLCENSVPTLTAVNCAFSFAENDGRLSRALVDIRSELLEGASLASCFGKCFEKAGLKREGLLLSENLALCEESGLKTAFKKTLSLLDARKNRQEKLLLSSLQPVLLLLASVYITLILKAAFLPYITNFGGLI